MEQASKRLMGLTHTLPLVSFEYHLWSEEIHKTIECVKYLARIFEDVEINITPAEKSEFMFSKWLSADKFLNIFPECLTNQEGYQYGDVFIRKKQI